MRHFVGSFLQLAGYVLNHIVLSRLTSSFHMLYYFSNFFNLVIFKETFNIAEVEVLVVLYNGVKAII